MIKTEVEAIFKNVSTNLGIPIYYYDDKLDDGFHGITDNQINYGYIRLRTGRNDAQQFSVEDADDYGFSLKTIKAKYWLVLHLNTVDPEQDLKTVMIHLKKELSINATGGSVDSEAIYKEQTGMDLQNNYTNLICVWIDVSVVDSSCCKSDPCLTFNSC